MKVKWNRIISIFITVSLLITLLYAFSCTAFGDEEPEPKNCDAVPINYGEENRDRKDTSGWFSANELSMLYYQGKLYYRIAGILRTNYLLDSIDGEAVGQIQFGKKSTYTLKDLDELYVKYRNDADVIVPTEENQSNYLTGFVTIYQNKKQYSGDSEEIIVVHEYPYEYHGRLYLADVLVPKDSSGTLMTEDLRHFAHPHDDIQIDSYLTAAEREHEEWYFPIIPL